jgi:molecular chaperone DnaK (HSP70)
MYNNERKVFSAIAVTGMILQKLKETTENATQRPCVDVVIGVPGWWTDRQRRAMMDASKIAGLNALRLMNEITASKSNYVKNRIYLNSRLILGNLQD